MTLHAARDGEDRKDGTVTFHVTYGPVTVRVVEPDGHVLQFWHELGKLVATEDNERRARDGWQRYVASHADRDDMPPWERLHEEERTHWIAAFTE